MSVIESTTGHSGSKEKSIARILYISIGIAIVLGIVTALFAWRSDRSLNPMTSDSTQQMAPDAGAPPALPTSPQPPAQ